MQLPLYCAYEKQIGRFTYHLSITSVKPQLSADLCYRQSVHQLSTTILRTFTRLYGKIYKDDAELRLCSKTG